MDRGTPDSAQDILPALSSRITLGHHMGYQGLNLDQLCARQKPLYYGFRPLSISANIQRLLANFFPFLTVSKLSSLSGRSGKKSPFLGCHYVEVVLQVLPSSLRKLRLSKAQKLPPWSIGHGPYFLLWAMWGQPWALPPQQWGLSVPSLHCTSCAVSQEPCVDRALPD